MKFYCITIALTSMVGAYFIGRATGRSAAKVEIAARDTITNEKIIKTMECVNAEIIHIGTGDIRRILHEQYTIAE
ncbi:MAG: hypothetical protein IJ560_01740 [Alphaproteobacteria bacterium]|nr:hypothetical protein [Alphaproteobacteria bacterium]